MNANLEFIPKDESKRRFSVTHIGTKIGTISEAQNGRIFYHNEACMSTALPTEYIEQILSKMKELQGEVSYATEQSVLNTRGKCCIRKLAGSRGI